MFLVLKGEMLHRRNNLAERIDNLCHRRYLPVEVPAEDIYAKAKYVGLPKGINLHHNPSTKEADFGTPKPEVFCCVHEVQETWDEKRELVVEDNKEPLKARGSDPLNECFQVGRNTAELEMVKIGECDVCDDRRVRKLSLQIAAGNRGFKANCEHPQLGHERDPLEQSIWLDVRGWVDHVEIECDETHSSREQSSSHRKGKASQPEGAHMRCLKCFRKFQDRILVLNGKPDSQELEDWIFVFHGRDEVL